MKRTLTTVFLLSTLLMGCTASRPSISPLPLPEIASQPPLTVVYPRPAGPDTLLTASDTLVVLEEMPDSLFAFGRVNDTNGKLRVNGVEIPIRENGAWLSWTAVGLVDTLAEAPDSATAELLTPPILSTDLTFDFESPLSGRQTRTARMLASLKRNKPWTLPRQPDSTALTVTADNAKIRVGWPGTTNLYPLVGTSLYATASSDTGTAKLYRLDMPGGLRHWIESEYVEVDSSGNRTPIQVVERVGSEVERHETRVLIPLEQVVPYEVERVSNDQLELTLFSAVSWTDVILQPTGSRVVDELHWSQPDSGIYCLTAEIDPAWLWGWDVELDEVDTTLVWTVYQAPEIGTNPLQGITVVVDAGHGGENISAIGPTGLFESRANLALAKAIASELESAGAEVLMTREADTLIGLQERIDFANEWDAEILISVHHNGLPQGVNPYRSRGASVHYFHRHAKPLADAILGELAKHGDVAGVKYQDLALARPSWLPAILFEAGYLLHPEEEELARSAEWQARIAADLTHGIKNYLLQLRAQQQQR